MDIIVHICSSDAWQAVQITGEYQTDSLEREGFIHCSRPEQVITVANRFYKDNTGLLLIWIDPLELDHELRWEVSDGDEYPHIYGPINLKAVLGTSSFPPDADGVFRSLPALV